MTSKKNGGRTGKRKPCKWAVCLDSHLLKKLFSFNNKTNTKKNNSRIKIF